jgi:hypothetical protein
MSIEARYYYLTHGVHGFITLYVLIALFSLAGLKRARATFDKYFGSSGLRVGKDEVLIKRQGLFS